MLACPLCAARYPRQGGIWRMLDASSAAETTAFLRGYRRVRDAEGWGGDDAAFYRALPYEDRSGRHPEIWRIRAKSYDVLVRRVLRPAARRGPLRIADLGAGNGWLARRLAERGHHVAAVDLDDDSRDGLGAHHHYGSPPPFVVVQASFDRLPWGPASFDLTLFDGTLHYSARYEATLAEALRVLAADGRIAVLDSPFYPDEASGEAMVRERTDDFSTRHGIAPRRNEAYLTQARLTALGTALGVRWRTYRPWYGLRWAVRPWIHRLRRQRPPVRFSVFVGRVVD